MLLNDNSEEANESMLELLNECFNYTKMIQDKLIVIQEEKLLCISMGINEDLQKTIERYQQLEGHIKPSPFVSSFKNEYKEYNTYVPKYKVKIELKKEQQLNQPLISFDDINYNSNNNQPNIDLIDLTKQNKEQYILSYLDSNINKFIVFFKVFFNCFF